MSSPDTVHTKRLHNENMRTRINVLCTNTVLCVCVGYSSKNMWHINVDGNLQVNTRGDAFKQCVCVSVHMKWHKISPTHIVLYAQLLTYKQTRKKVIRLRRNKRYTCTFLKYYMYYVDVLYVQRAERYSNDLILNKKTLRTKKAQQIHIVY